MNNKFEKEFDDLVLESKKLKEKVERIITDESLKSYKDGFESGFKKRI